MRINYNVTGKDRKALVNFIAESLEEKAEYLGVPSCAYKIGDFTVTKDGGLEFEDDLDATNLIEAIREAGFESDNNVKAEVAEEQYEEETAQPTADGLTIGMPRSFFTDASLENLKKIIESKATLIKAALNIDELPIEVDDEKVEFPWFPNPDAETSAAAVLFIAKLSEMAKNATRVTATDKEVDNPKYAMRCFLLRLGFIGAEYKDARKILLKNLSGNSSWKNGRKEESEDEITE
jgi:hypothetical protein